MDSYDQTTQFRYTPMEDGTEFSGILEIFVHQARNIHNICIYDNQDVYAKFSLTYNPDETFSTRVINGGGKNPEFNEKLVIKINQFDAGLKCEMWMLSRVKSFMEDQLLGFSLVPVSLIGTGEFTRDFSLSSTDLFHSPAGTVRLSLSLNTNSPTEKTISSTTDSSIMSEVVLLDPIEYSMIEFPDINVVTENQQMVSEYFGLSSRDGPAVVTTKPGSFLCLGASMSDAPEVFSSTVFVSSGIEERNSDDSLEMKNNLLGESSNSIKKEVKEESKMQQQIVDLYMKSMQQFTESLANMKLPLNLEKMKVSDGRGDIIQRPENTSKMMEEKKKYGGRVFYGCRAFF